ncbi:hypothetical protein [Polaribacter sp.]|uniref:hypothetical protein n=1 Tax=Polaribacter sp. TaxID=1920175 RepID=UPI0040489EA1
MLKKILIGLSIVVGIGLLIFVGYIVMIIHAFGGFDKDYSVTELKENFEAKKTEIYEIKNFVNKIMPSGKLVHIEFEDNNTMFIFHVNEDDKFENNWDVKINSAKADTLLKKLGWKLEDLKTLKEKLDKANCIGVSSGEPCKINFQRSGMGMYSFNVFDQPISDTLIEQYNDSCTYILVNRKLALEYVGGAIGRQCFYNLE